MEVKEFFGLGALILSIVNGLALLRFYLRDKPKLTVYPIHPDVYQWWFKLLGGEYEGKPTRKYGFLAYIGVSNHGLRKVSLSSWRLFINTALGEQVELKPISIPEPRGELSIGTKIWPVLGQKGLLFEGSTVIDSGCSISGMVYYFVEFYGEEGWNPKFNEGKITGKFIVKDVFNKKSQIEIAFSEKPLEEVKVMIEGIEGLV